MKNKQHEYILKAYIKSNVHRIIREEVSDLILLDSIIGGYCTQLIKGKKHFQLPTEGIISTEEKKIFSKLINKVKDEDKRELVVYYRLMVLAEDIIYMYS